MKFCRRKSRVHERKNRPKHSATLRKSSVFLGVILSFCRAPPALGAAKPGLAVTKILATRFKPILAGTYDGFIPERGKGAAFPQSPKIHVRAFQLAITPVTNGDFLGFVTERPEWGRSQIKRLFADSGYLRHWQSDTVIGSEYAKAAPVVYVSWFAARAFCAWTKGRLSTTAEWEWAARPAAYQGPGMSQEEINKMILEWYSRPSDATTMGLALDGPKNRYGLHALHGLIWEWTEDFNSIMIGEESRDSSSPDKNLFCGAGALGGSNPENYAAYMRFAFRSSLKGAYTVGNLGFRCAK